MPPRTISQGSFPATPLRPGYDHGISLSITSYGLMFKPIGRDTPQRLSNWARGIERIRTTRTKRAVMVIIRSIEPPRLLSLRPLFTIRWQGVLTGSFTSLHYLNPTQSYNTKRFPIPPSHFYLPHIKAVCSPLHLFLSSSSTHPKTSSKESLHPLTPPLLLRYPRLSARARPCPVSCTITMYRHALLVYASVSAAVMSWL